MLPIGKPPGICIGLEHMSTSPLVLGRSFTDSSNEKYGRYDTGGVSV